MDKITQQIEVMAAWKNCKQIQVKVKNLVTDPWEDIPNPSWNWDRFDYRIKPETPKEDPYKKFKDALAEGRQIEFLTDAACWVAAGRELGWGADPSRYRIAKRKVKYWPAVCHTNGKNGYMLMDQIFCDEVKAKEMYPSAFIRLATELPPIIIEED